MRVAVIHPWFPQYRARFFEDLVTQAAARGLEIDLFHGDPPPEWATRGDSVSSKIARRVETRFFKVGARSLVYKSLRDVRGMGPYDLIIVEQGVRNLETYRLILSSRRTPVAFWGHGKTYTKHVGDLQERLKMLLTRRGRWFFAYTAGGVEAVVAKGFPSNRTTVVQNTIDVSELAKSINNVTQDQRLEFSQKNDLHGQSAFFIGGLDSSKRLPFLLAACAEVYKSNNKFRLVIAGNGEDRAFIQDAAKEHPWVKYIGSVFGNEKAVAMNSCQVLAMPGRVGLVAVDSFAARLPIVTTDWPWHAPESEYLQNDDNSMITRDSVSDYAEGLSSLLSSKERLEELRQGCSRSARKYVLENMVSNFIKGLESYRQMEML